YSAGLLGLLSIKILAPGFYAKQDIRTPVRIAILVLVLTQLMNLLFVPLFAHAGLALSVGLGAMCNAAMLLFTLHRRRIYMPAPGWSLFIARLILPLGALAALLWAASHQLDWLALGATPLLRALWMAGVIAACTVTYFLTLWIAGFRPKDFTRRGR